MAWLLALVNLVILEHHHHVALNVSPTRNVLVTKLAPNRNVLIHVKQGLVLHLRSVG